MGKYILLGMQPLNSSTNNVRIVHAADEYDQLVGIWDTIDKFYSQLDQDGHDGLNAVSRQMIAEHPYLGSMYEVYESIIFTVNILGIFEALKVDPRRSAELV